MPIEIPNPDEVIKDFAEFTEQQKQEAFPVNSFPAPLAEYIKQSAISLNVDEGMIGLPLLAGLASAIGNTHMININADWHEPSILWCAVVCPSGEGKSPSAYAALKGVYHENKLLLSEHSPDSDQPQKFCIANDVTIEKLFQMLRDNPRGILLHRDELAAWLNFSRYNQSKSMNADWLSLFDGRECSIHRKNSGSFCIPQPRLSVYGTIQPRILTQHMNEENTSSGLMARFLFSMPTPRKRYLLESEPTFSDGLKKLFSGLYRMNLDPYGEPHILKLSKDAYELFKRKHDELEDLRHQEGNNLISIAIPKLKTNLARITLVLHCAQSIEEGAGGPALHEVKENTVQASCNLISYFYHQAIKVYDSVPSVKEAAHPCKTTRDATMLEMHHKGLNNCQIAEMLNLSEGTVRNVLKKSYS